MDPAILIFPVFTSDGSGFQNCLMALLLLQKFTLNCCQVDTGTSTDAATLTEPDALGPCEPGTAVNLEGIVWHETDTGKKNNNLPGPRRRRHQQLSPAPLWARTGGSHPAAAV